MWLTQIKYQSIYLRGIFNILSDCEFLALISLPCAQWVSKKWLLESNIHIAQLCLHCPWWQAMVEYSWSSKTKSRSEESFANLAVAPLQLQSLGTPLFFIVYCLDIWSIQFPTKTAWNTKMKTISWQRMSCCSGYLFSSVGIFADVYPELMSFLMMSILN